jgi:hypothetical protein
MEIGMLRGIKPEGKVTLHHAVVKEVLLDKTTLVAEAKHKFLEAIMGIDLHDVPKDGLSADFHQRFRAELGLFPQPGSQPPTQNDHFHFRYLVPLILPAMNTPGEPLAPLSSGA